MRQSSAVFHYTTGPKLIHPSVSANASMTRIESTAKIV